jgi:anaerobic selenocysteine-containing dehydrogenase
MDECERGLARNAGDALLLIGRRELRTCNSWMHNVPAMVAGRERCLLYVHPDDAAKAGVRDGDEAVLESRVHTGRLRVRVTDDVCPGVVSLPHGWGHAESAPWQRVAGAHPGVSVNDWTDDQRTESVVGRCASTRPSRQRWRPPPEEKAMLRRARAGSRSSSRRRVG